MSLIEFESAREKEKKRQWEREAREAVLEKAKNKYEADKLKDEARRQRGEHEWMLPSVKEKIESEAQEKKHKKKKKKEKKKKKKAAKEKHSSTSSESDENEMWVEKPSASVPVKSAEHHPCEQLEVSRETSKRDGWMEMTSLFKTYSRDEIKEIDGTSRRKEKEEEKRRKQEADKPGSHARELNPYYKNGGCGLPEEDQLVNKSSSPAVGLDATWLRKALQRAKEQAQLENKTLEEIAAQRWGSLEKFNELLAEAEGREADSRRSSWSRKSEEWKGRGQVRDKDYTSRERRRSREDRSRSRDRWSKSRDRRRSRSREMGKNSNRRSRSKDRRDRNKEGKRSSSRGRSESEEWNRSKEKKNRGRKHSSSSSSSNDSRSSKPKDVSREERTNRNETYKQPPTESRLKSVSGLMKPADVDCAGQRSSVLARKFQKPGEEPEPRSSSNISNRMPSGSSRGWQKKEYVQEQQKSQDKSKQESSSSSDSETSDEESVHNKSLQEESVEVVEKPENKLLLTDKEMNELAAKIMKAELVGNDALASKLKKKLEAARSTRASPSIDGGGRRKESGSHEEIVVLTRTDARGFSRPVNIKESESERKKKGKMKTHGIDGKRLRYFPDDDKYDLKQMFEAEKGTTAEDQNAMFSRAAMKNTERLDDDYDMDDMFMSKAAKKEDAAKQAERDKKKAVQEHQRSQRSLESCQWCFENKEMTKHLIVALGSKAYVCLPPHESLTSGHCLIVPIHHVMCSVQADEDLWSEIQSFRRSLVRMFNSRDEDCIFFETAKRFRNYPHMVIHCVPLPKDIGDMAPVYFKKAIMECETEWAQNKKLVDLKNRDVRKAVPKGLPYFFIDFAMDPGYAHVIEDEQDFPNNFAQEIVGGMLDLEPNMWRKPRKENFEVQRRKVMEFSRFYKEFDITQDEK
ncbi:CWF19-like protein 2 isoform X2 [Macrobrachium rosenbergii]|uniref:CWF19-like protein 2 isoform X2 n=1 Tax=Macrobrachium rosenbergii TaxID=79674 RepID=UPI0034D7228E